MKCENCNQEERWIKAEYSFNGGFYRCYHTIGVSCECGHWHKSHYKNKCLKCNCQKFVKRLQKTEQGK